MGDDTYVVNGRKVRVGHVWGDPAGIPDDALDQMVVDGYALVQAFKCVESLVRLRVTSLTGTDEGTFGGVSVNYWDGIVLYIDYVRRDSITDEEIKGRVGIPGKHILRLEVVEG